MSLPKEPRQKMINMMYLVLTALLALNVSAEILNAFKVVNNSIANSNGVLSTENNNIYSSLKEKVSRPETKEKAAIWAPKAFAIEALSKEAYDSIEDLKNRLLLESKWDPAHGDTSSYRPDDLDAATRIFDEEGEGPKLYQLLKKYKSAVLQDPALAKEFDGKLPLDLTVPPSQEGITPTGDTSKNWTVNYFNMTPTVAAVTILSKFQNDIKNSENNLVTYCHDQIGAVEVRYDKTGVIAVANATYLMPGDKLQVSAGVGAFSSAAHPTITINGVPVDVDPSGKATKDITVGGGGDQFVKIGGSYKDQDGKIIPIKEEIKYKVGIPSGVAVSADKMNVLYIMGDQPNPLTISGGSGSEKIQATLTGGTLKKIQGSSWEAFPTTPGEQTINVTIDGKTTSKKFRVKYLPNPIAFVGSHKSGLMSAAEFKANAGLVTRLDDAEFEAAFKVISYTLSAVGGSNFSLYTTSNNQGNRWTGKASRIVNRVTPGTHVYFDDIRVVGPDGREREIQPISFNLK